MRRLVALTITVLLCWSPACQRNSEERPAPDMAAEPVPEQAPGSAEAPAPAAAVHAVGSMSPREPDYAHLAQIRQAGEKSKGKMARMYLKLSQRAKTPGYVTLIATDGSYATALLHFRDEFTSIIEEMQPGYVYEVEFEIERVSTGGQPQGEILAIDRKSAGPVRDQTKFLPAIEAIQRAQQSPSEVKEARRQQLQERLGRVVDTAEENKEEIQQIKESLPGRGAESP